MDRRQQNRGAERLGSKIARAWMAARRARVAAERWLVAQGVAQRVAHILINAGVALGAVLVLVASIEFALAIVVIAVLLICLSSENHVDRNAAIDPEWRDGPSGYGLYDNNGFRIDAHDSRKEH